MTLTNAGESPGIVGGNSSTGSEYPTDTQNRLAYWLFTNLLTQLKVVVNTVIRVLEPKIL